MLAHCVLVLLYYLIIRHSDLSITIERCKKPHAELKLYLSIESLPAPQRAECRGFPIEHSTLNTQFSIFIEETLAPSGQKVGRWR